STVNQLATHHQVTAIQKTSLRNGCFHVPGTFKGISGEPSPVRGRVTVSHEARLECAMGLCNPAPYGARLTSKRAHLKKGGVMSSRKPSHRKDRSRLTLETLEARIVFNAGMLDPSFNGTGMVVTDVGSQTEIFVEGAALQPALNGRKILVVD